MINSENQIQPSSRHLSDERIDDDAPAAVEDNPIITRNFKITSDFKCISTADFKCISLNDFKHGENSFVKCISLEDSDVYLWILSVYLWRINMWRRFKCISMKDSSIYF